jgi:gliding motility-associated lipoprotein GldH
MLLAIVSCDKSRLYEKNMDFKNQVWHTDSIATFHFDIADAERNYNIYYNIRNTIDYPYARIFITWQLQDTLNITFHEKLQYNYLFDEKTGKPFGKSSIGDIYTHRFLLLENYKFPQSGYYRIKLAQFNRIEELNGVIAAGIRVEVTD